VLKALISQAFQHYYQQGMRESNRKGIFLKIPASLDFTAFPAKLFCAKSGLLWSLPKNQ
jgi:hypothetical protein